MNRHFFKHIGHWLSDRLGRTAERDHYFTMWFSVGFFIATTGIGIVEALGNPTGANVMTQAMDIGKAITINGFIFTIWMIMVGALFSLIYLPLPRLMMASLSYTMTLSVIVLQIEKTGKLFSYIMSIGYSFVVMVMSLFLIILLHKKMRPVFKVIVVGILLISASVYVVADKLDFKQQTAPVIAEYTEPISDENPAHQGDFDYTFLTYGSGKDLHRDGFGTHVNEQTPTVDASDFITGWRNDRKDFWGFDQSELPVNGRAWLPEGTGPFPIVLMVHGNHTMEYFSTSGYDYLGELLASRGFIAISVDEDFINYSNAYGIPNANYELRAWMIMQHLTHLQTMNISEDNAFYQKIDFDQVGLMGHSRGGQAVAMTADYTTFFEDEDLLSNMEAVNIQGVVAIAPTDKSLDGKKPSIHNASYLLMHGARDADVYNFRGDQQFYRTTLDPNTEAFKATLYIEGANHTQFNSDWGHRDLSLPRGLFLNQSQTMEATHQREIAKVYMSAFFERVFNGQASYDQLFQDYRYGQKWLPDTTLVGKYRHASYRPIIVYDDYEADIDHLDGFSKREIERPTTRSGSDRARDALRLEWEEDASYTLDIKRNELMAGEHIVLTMANMDGDLGETMIPNINVELETIDGRSVQLPLNDFMPMPPVIKTDFTHFGLWDAIFRDGKYENAWEPIFQTFEVPIEAFLESDRSLRKENIQKLTLHFKSHPGKIMIEEIGVW